MPTKKELQKSILKKRKQCLDWMNQLSISLESVDEEFDNYKYEDLRYIDSAASNVLRILQKTEKDLVKKYA